MGNVYLSVLGTNDYLPCNYHNENGEGLKNVRFIQEATLSINCRDWTPTDRIYILTTEEAKKKNWEDNGHGKMCEGLKSRIATLQLNAKSERIPIPSGKTIDEIWDIFKKIYDLLKEGDNVIFDITHALRSIPMLAIVVLNYAKALKDIHLKGIYYGAFEVLGPPKQVKEKIPIEERDAPIFDLTAFNSLMEWAVAINRFLKSGDATHISELSESELKPILKDQIPLRDAANKMRKFSKQLLNFSQIMSTCRGQDITQSTMIIKNSIQELIDTDIIPPMKPLLEKIQQQMEKFKDDDIFNGIQAAKWCLEHNMVQQGFTILQETFISLLVRKTGADMLDEKKRRLVNMAVRIAREKTPESRCPEDDAMDHNTTRSLVDIFTQNKPLADLMAKLTNDRNDINHSGIRINAMPAKNFIEHLKECIAEAEKIMECFPSV